jgi:hypothetical protein
MHENEADVVDIGVMWLGAGGGCQHWRLARGREAQSLNLKTAVSR